MLVSVVNVVGVLVAVVAFGGRGAEVAAWTHAGADSWANDYPNCGGQQQSPVDINTQQVAFGSFSPIQFHNYDILPIEQLVTNDGHSIKVEITSVFEMPYIAWGGPWFYQKNKYNFAQYHFHWGSVSSQGSEHTINSVRYPIELHLVHFNDKYADIGTAVTESDGLAVLGIFFEISTTDNPALAPLVSAIATVFNYDAGPKSVMANNLYALASLLPANTKRFYRYDGSLTTPTCDESVLWTVFEEPIMISEAQLDVFRTVLGAGDISTSDNYRPIQPLNRRKVKKSWK